MKHIKKFIKFNEEDRFNEDGDLIYTWETEWDKDTMDSLLNKAYNFICDFKYKGDCRNFNKFESPEVALKELEDVLDIMTDEEYYKYIKGNLYDKIKEKL